MLVFCVPFYDFLDQVGKKAAHSFKSETPLVDALIMFMREFKVLKSAPSVEQLNRILKNEDLERYGEPFTPEFVYDAIRHLPRFASMRVSNKLIADLCYGMANLFVSVAWPSTGCRGVLGLSAPVTG